LTFSRAWSSDVCSSDLKAIRDAGYAWAASLSRYTQRTKSWASAITAARLAGTPPAILRTLIEEAAHRAQAAPEAVPAQVWQAAGDRKSGGWAGGWRRAG